MCKITPYPLENFTLDWKLLHNQRLRWLWQISGMLVMMVMRMIMPGIVFLSLEMKWQWCWWNDDNVGMVLKYEMMIMMMMKWLLWWNDDDCEMILMMMMIYWNIWKLLPSLLRWKGGRRDIFKVHFHSWVFCLETTFSYFTIMLSIQWWWKLWKLLWKV